jgi:hypothetical protein
MKDPDYAAHDTVVRIANNTEADLYFDVDYKQQVVFSESSKKLPHYQWLTAVSGAKNSC